jgi:hypothetical protein
MPPDSADPLLQVTRLGPFIAAAGLYLDARWAPGRVFVSHADRIVCTPETASRVYTELT